MPDRLPPLTSLRAFEAAARHMSFSKAAEELHVTPAAMSFQIKSLEDHLGAPVFHRLNRAVELTEAGKALYPGVQDGFAALQGAWAAARRVLDTQTLTVTAGPAFTAKWLAPRMFGFARAHPDIELRFAATARVLDFERDGVDVAIRHGYGPDEGLFSMPILEDWFTPMMTPALAEAYKTPESLLAAPLLHDDSIAHFNPRCDWPEWFRANGFEAGPLGGSHFNQGDHAIDAALSGAGVLMGRVALTSDALQDGRLVAPFPVALTTEAQVRVLCPKGTETLPRVKAFIDWLRTEAQTDEALGRGRKFVAAAGPSP
ncbi:transcriptional regulator GcvA [Pseudoruegeria sp. HB172150]|uniref:transcriptional regulator GcvA n=1 Tax=Pseudoruegeria sp. HB172150 TaxID=2721164 RepID=UPI001553C567|nr:transcriptional regulator GcvA [Pseudoruegeria sp. HB172150]